MSSFNTEVTIDSNKNIENVIDTSSRVGSSARGAPLPSQINNDPTSSNISSVMDASNETNNIENTDYRDLSREQAPANEYNMKSKRISPATSSNKLEGSFDERKTSESSLGSTSISSRGNAADDFVSNVDIDGSNTYSRDGTITSKSVDNDGVGEITSKLQSQSLGSNSESTSTATQEGPESKPRAAPGSIPLEEKYALPAQVTPLPEQLSLPNYNRMPRNSNSDRMRQNQIPPEYRNTGGRGNMGYYSGNKPMGVPNAGRGGGAMTSPTQRNGPGNMQNTYGRGGYDGYSQGPGMHGGMPYQPMHHSGPNHGAYPQQVYQQPRYGGGYNNSHMPVQAPPQRGLPPSVDQRDPKEVPGVPASAAVEEGGVNNTRASPAAGSHIPPNVNSPPGTTDAARNDPNGPTGSGVNKLPPPVQTQHRQNVPQYGGGYGGPNSQMHGYNISPQHGPALGSPSHYPQNRGMHPQPHGSGPGVGIGPEDHYHYMEGYNQRPGPGPSRGSPAHAHHPNHSPPPAHGRETHPITQVPPYGHAHGAPHPGNHGPSGKSRDPAGQPNSGGHPYSGNSHSHLIPQNINPAVQPVDATALAASAVKPLPGGHPHSQHRPRDGMMIPHYSGPAPVPGYGVPVMSRMNVGHSPGHPSVSPNQVPITMHQPPVQPVVAKPKKILNIVGKDGSKIDLSKTVPVSTPVATVPPPAGFEQTVPSPPPVPTPVATVLPPAGFEQTVPSPPPVPTPASDNVCSQVSEGPASVSRAVATTCKNAARVPTKQPVVSDDGIVESDRAPVRVSTKQPVVSDNGGDSSTGALDVHVPKDVGESNGFVVEDDWEKEDFDVVISAVVEAVKPATPSQDTTSGIASIVDRAPGIVTIPGIGAGTSRSSKSSKYLKTKMAEADSRDANGDLLDAYTTPSKVTPCKNIQNAARATPPVVSTPATPPIAPVPIMGIVNVSPKIATTKSSSSSASDTSTTGISLANIKMSTTPSQAPPTPPTNTNVSCLAPRLPVHIQRGGKTISPSTSAAILNAGSVATTPSPQPAPEEQSVTTDSWDEPVVASASAVTATPSPSAGATGTRRELRPAASMRSKLGSSRGNSPALSKHRFTYTKEEMFTIFEIVNSAGLINSASALSTSTRYSNISFGVPPSPSSSAHSNRNNNYDHRNDSYNRSGIAASQGGNQRHYAHSGDNSWKRGDAQPHNNKRGNRNNRNQVSTPMPKKVITDPVEQLQRNVKAILNKITPQTFDKLTNQMCEFVMQTSAMLDVMIHEIFEKAVDEPKFSQIYAEMCFKIEESERLRLLSFLHIIYNKDSNQYMWIRDLNFERVHAAGPYRDENECIQAAMCVTLPPMPLLDNADKIEISKLLISNDIFISIFKNIDTNAFFMSCCPFSEVMSQVSDKAFQDHDSARADAIKVNTLRRRIIGLCQQEYVNATQKEGVYAKFQEAEDQIKRDVEDGVLSNAPDSDEMESRLNDLEFLRVKLKQRMMGNIRFVGELFKMKLVPARVMYDCINEILLERDEEGNPSNWKEVNDESDIELLCKLLRTVGILLDEASNKSASRGNGNADHQMNLYFQRLEYLSRDKSLGARVRFTIMEVMELRANNWRERRAEEKPKTIEEIHAAAAEEERFNSNQNQNSRYIMNRNSNSNTLGNGDARNMKGNSNTNVTPSKKNKQKITGIVQPGGNNDKSVASLLQQYTARGGVTPKIKRSSGNQPSTPSSLNSANSKQTPQTSVLTRDYVSFFDYPEKNRAALNVKITGMLKDYINIGNFQDAMERIEDSAAEHPPHIFGAQFVLSFIDMSLECKQSTQTTLLEFLNHPESLLPKYLTTSKSEIEATIPNCDNILMMHESLFDYKNAPEWIGSILSFLIHQVKACDLDVALNAADSGWKLCLEDEFANQESGRDAFDRLKVAIHTVNK